MINQINGALESINKTNMPVQPINSSNQRKTKTEQKKENGFKDIVRAKDQEDKKQEDNVEQIKKAVEEANKKARIMNTAREFSYDDATNRICVKVTDTETKEVIREIPTEEAIKRLTRMLEDAGLVFDKTL